MSDSEPISAAAADERDAIVVHDLAKTFRTPFQGRRVEAVRGISFAVGRGEVFGFLGPNGAGKTTTIRILMGLIAASRGRASIFGHPVPSRAARQTLGFLPEAPYFYDYLTAPEMLDLTGRLFGMDRRQRRRRADQLLDQVGLAHATRMPLKKFSKGMLQRAGIAQALLSDPPLIVLDEPLSGLDPIGRKDVLDLIRSARDRGTTVFFSSHILTDVEHVSDRIAIVARGQIRAYGELDELLSADPGRVDVRLRLPAARAGGHAEDGAGSEDSDGPVAGVDRDDGHVGDDGQAGDDSQIGGDGDDSDIRAALRPLADTIDRDGDLLTAVLTGEDSAARDLEIAVDRFLARARELGCRVVSVIPHRPSLQDLFIRCTGET